MNAHSEHPTQPQMRILYFDTETNGLPKDRKALTRDTHAWPHVVQIAWQVYEYTESTSDPVLISRVDYILQPDTSLTEWNAESAAIHGISRAMAEERGRPGVSVLAEFMGAAKDAHVLVAHNMAFDKPVLRAAYYRINPDEKFLWWPALEYCTMENTKSICKLPSKYSKPHDPYKYPRLSELHTHLFGDDGTVFAYHNASADVDCLVKCTHELIRRRLVPFDVWERAFRVRRPDGVKH